jgi:hypothetical protein
MRDGAAFPTSLKFILFASLFTLGASAVIYGGLIASGNWMHHATGFLMAIPVFLGAVLGVGCITQLPSAVRAWNQSPELRTIRVGVILVLGSFMSLVPIILVGALWKLR